MGGKQKRHTVFECVHDLPPSQYNPNLRCSLKVPHFQKYVLYQHNVDTEVKSF